MTINDPEVVAELSALYPRYEQALVHNDVGTAARGLAYCAGPCLAFAASVTDCQEQNHNQLG
jgi:hypothetical protein